MLGKASLSYAVEHTLNFISVRAGVDTQINDNLDDPYYRAHVQGHSRDVVLWFFNIRVTSRGGVFRDLPDEERDG